MLLGGCSRKVQERTTTRRSGVFIYRQKGACASGGVADLLFLCRQPETMPGLSAIGFTEASCPLYDPSGCYTNMALPEHGGSYSLHPSKVVSSVKACCELRGLSIRTLGAVQLQSLPFRIVRSVRVGSMSPADSQYRQLKLHRGPLARESLRYFLS